MKAIAAAEITSIVGKNVYKMKEKFDLDPWRHSSEVFQNKYSYYEVPEVDKWRLPLLNQLLATRNEMKVCGEDTETIDGLIESLCHS